MVDAVTLGRLRFRAWRRGFREADLILGPFADAHLPAMSAEELDGFERLLAEADHDLYAWIVAGQPAPPHIDPELLSRLRAFRPPAALGG